MKETDMESLLFTKKGADIVLTNQKDAYTDYALEQYKAYLLILNSTADRSHKANEFFLGLNAAILGILGYVEAKSLPHGNIIFMLIPFAGISISYTWYRIINSYSDLNRAKFKVIHAIEEKLPVSLFKAEWYFLQNATRRSKYTSFSRIEKHVPITFIVLYIIILLVTTWP